MQSISNEWFADNLQVSYIFPRSSGKESGNSQLFLVSEFQ